MSDKKRTLWDDIIDLGHDIVETLDEAMHPEKKRKPVRVPIPVRQHPPRRHPRNDTY